MHSSLAEDIGRALKQEWGAAGVRKASDAFARLCGPAGKDPDDDAGGIDPERCVSGRPAPPLAPGTVVAQLPFAAAISMTAAATALAALAVGSSADAKSTHPPRSIAERENTRLGGATDASTARSRPPTLPAEAPMHAPAGKATILGSVTLRGGLPGHRNVSAIVRRGPSGRADAAMPPTAGRSVASSELGRQSGTGEAASRLSSPGLVETPANGSVEPGPTKRAEATAATMEPLHDAAGRGMDCPVAAAIGPTSDVAPKRDRSPSFGASAVSTEATSERLVDPREGRSSRGNQVLSAFRVNGDADRQWRRLPAGTKDGPRLARADDQPVRREHGQSHEHGQSDASIRSATPDTALPRHADHQHPSLSMSAHGGRIEASGGDETPASLSLLPDMSPTHDTTAGSRSEAARGGSTTDSGYDGATIDTEREAHDADARDRRGAPSEIRFGHKDHTAPMVGAARRAACWAAEEVGLVSVPISRQHMSAEPTVRLVAIDERSAGTEKATSHAAAFRERGGATQGRSPSPYASRAPPLARSRPDQVSEAEVRMRSG